MSELEPEVDPLIDEPDVEPDPEGTVPAEESTPEDPHAKAEVHATGWPPEHGGEG
jgi:hypothetical protein